MSGEIWTPDAGLQPLQPKTVKVNIGGVWLEVLEDAPPSKGAIPNLSHPQLVQVAMILSVQMQCALRELAEMQDRLTDLEDPEPEAAANTGDEKIGAA